MCGSMCTLVATLGVTLDVERFTGVNLNICSFNPIEAFVEILLCCLGQKCLLFSVTTEGLYSQKNFENHETTKVSPVSLSMATV